MWTPSWTSEGRGAGVALGGPGQALHAPSPGAPHEFRQFCLPARSYLQQLPEGGQDPFGNFTIDVGALPAVGFPGPAPMQQQPEVSQQPTTLTAQFGATTLQQEPPQPQRKPAQRKASQARGATSKTGEPLDAKSMRKQLALQEKNRRAQRRFRERQKQKVGWLGVGLGVGGRHAGGLVGQGARRARAQGGIWELSRGVGGWSTWGPHRRVCPRRRRAPPRRRRPQVEELTAQVEALTAQLNGVLAEKSGLESRNGVLENVLALRDKQLEAAARGEPVDVKPPPAVSAARRGAGAHCVWRCLRSVLAWARRARGPRVQEAALCCKQGARFFQVPQGEGVVGGLVYVFLVHATAGALVLL